MGKIEGKALDIGGMTNFVIIQMLQSKLLGVVISLAVTQDLTTPSWTMPQEQWALIVQGFAVCVVQMLLAFFGKKSFLATEIMYPPVDYKAGFPPDAVALLDMNGIDPVEWTKLMPMLEAGERAVDHNGPASASP